MAKKHFTAMAIEFGSILRDLYSNDDLTDVSANAAIDAIHATIRGFVRVAKSANSAFDATTFWNFIEDVQEGRRDLDGRIVK